MSRIRRILHPSDFSRASGAAFAKAVEMAKTNRAELFVVHVLTPVIPMVGDGYVSPKVYEEIEATARACQAECDIIPDVAHDSMLETRWQSVAARILIWLNERGL